MIYPYTALPGSTRDFSRPLVDIAVGDASDLLFPCLVDTGAINSLMPTWLADAGAISLRGSSRVGLGVGGITTSARFVGVRMSIGDEAWEADVGFCDDWPFAYGLLGHMSFFRYFEVKIRAFDSEFELSMTER